MLLVPPVVEMLHLVGTALRAVDCTKCHRAYVKAALMYVLTRDSFFRLFCLGFRCTVKQN